MVLKCGLQQIPMEVGTMPKQRVPRHEVIQPTDPSYRLIALTRGKTTIVDAADYDWLNQFMWAATRTKKRGCFYAYRAKGSPKHVYMHREIMQPEGNQQVDHRDGDGLNNRRSNLRICNRFQNAQNSKRNV